jgi:hypothetical protein
MGETSKSFDAVLLAGVSSVLGSGFILSAMIALLSGSGSTTAMVLAGSIPVGTVVGVLLLLTAGALGTEQRWARHLGILSFGGVVVFGNPVFTPLSALSVFYSVVSAFATLYLLFRNPIAKTDRSQVDESESATKVGSTIR